MKLARPLAIALTAVLGAASAMQAAGTQPSSVTTSFPLKIFKEVAKGRGSENVLISPYSISTALTMTYLGAAGGTKTAMGDVLNLTGTEADIGTHCKEVRDSLQNPGANTQLAIANALFADKEIKFKDQFLNANKQYFNAGVTALDFKAPSSPGAINNFVSESTHGKITRIVDKIPDDAILYLVNAIYFKGNWENKFDKNATQPRAFHLAGGQSKDMPMMNMHRSDFRYFETSDFQAINLGYADKRLSMYVFLPKESTTLDAFEAQLNDTTWSKWKGQFRFKEGNLSMPKFLISDDMKLKAPLSAMGMQVAFSRKNADFTDMNSKEHPCISEVLHKTYMEVNEEGTEAAAVTSVGMMKTATMHMPEQPFNMIVDRPYFIALRDSKTDTLLFVGHIADPSAK